MKHQPRTESCHHRVEAIARTHGFSLLGDIEVTGIGRVVFPTPPMGGGLYLLTLWAGGNYIGECRSYGPEIDADGNQTFGRFKNYINPADDIWTELVINAMLRKGRGGKVYLLPMTGAKSDRTTLERTFIAIFRKCNVLLWNTGIGRDERTYWSYKMPIFERAHSDVVSRYTTRPELTLYATKRLAAHHRWASVFRAKAKALILTPEDYVWAVDGDQIVRRSPKTILQSPCEEAETRVQITAMRQPKTRGRIVKVRESRQRSAISIQSLVHDYRARYPDASKKQIIAEAVPLASRTDRKSIRTIGTLFTDFSMTLEALMSMNYVKDERKTFIIRQSVCRLWKQYGSDITAKMVEQDLIAEGHQRNAGSIQQITANVKSSLRALEAAGRL